ncbi:MAG: hypothetical protein ABIL25_04415 [candidate division WOR-3 bacterium]
MNTVKRNPTGLVRQSPWKLLALGLLVLTLAAGCVTGTAGVKQSSIVRPELPTSTAPVETTQFEVPGPLPPLAEPGEVAEPVPGGEVDWSGEVVRARGLGVVDPGATNPAQARLMAERAAVVVAQRNLLEIVKGVRVDSDTRVENLMTDYDVVYSRVEGLVKGARQRGPAKYDSLAGTVEVELEMSLYGSGLADALVPVLGPGDVAASSLSPQVRQFLAQYSGLVLDGSSSGLKPALFPKIYDADGNLLLDTRQYAAHLGSTGQAAIRFINDLDKVLSRPELTRLPLVLKVKEVRGKLGADIIIGRQDAEKLKWLKDGFKYLVGAGRFLLKVLL